MPIGEFLVYDSLNKDLDAITIYKHVKTLYHQDKPANQELLNFLRGCMAGRLVNATVTFIPFSVFIEATLTSACN